MAFRRRPAGLFRAAAVLLGATLVTIARADEAEDVAKPLSNPVASFPFNHDRDIGPARDGSRWLLNIPPVLPFGLTEKGNLISHTILLVLQQKDLFPGAGRQSGIGDVVQGVFFSPKAPTAGGVTWGAGPVFLIPTGSNHLLTTDKCGVGPNRMARRQDGPSIAGGAGQPHLVVCRQQPPRRCQCGVRPAVSDLHHALGRQLVQVGVLGRHWVSSRPQGLHGWRLRPNVTVVLSSCDGRYEPDRVEEVRKADADENTRVGCCRNGADLNGLPATA